MAINRRGTYNYFITNVMINIYIYRERLIRRTIKKVSRNLWEDEGMGMLRN